MRGTKNAIEREREAELQKIAGFINNNAVDNRLKELCFDTEATTESSSIDLDGEDLDYYSIEVDDE
jgi:hypothetical protein